MKTLITLLILVPFISLSQVDYKSIKKSLPKGLYLTFDKYTQKTWIGCGDLELGQDPLFRDNKVRINFYFGIDKNGEKGPLRVNIKYHGQGWMFIKSLTFLTGTMKEINSGMIEPIKVRVKDDSPVQQVFNGGYVKETLDFKVDAQMYEWMELFDEDKPSFTNTKVSGTDFYSTYTSFGKHFKRKIPLILKYYREYGVN